MDAKHHRTSGDLDDEWVEIRGRRRWPKRHPLELGQRALGVGGGDQRIRVSKLLKRPGVAR